MLSKLFKDIAEEEGAKLEITDEILDFGDGSRCPHLVYKIRLIYKEKHINFINKTGTQFYGLVSCDFPEKLKNLEFEITTRSHFTSLFVKNKERIKITTQSAKINSFLKQSSAFRELVQISNNTVFEPWILAKNIEEKYNITTKYSLQFSDWTQSIRPIIKFQKEFIDYFN